MIEMGAAAVVAHAEPVGTAVGYVQAPATMAAAHQAGQQGLAPANRAAGHEPLAVGVVGDQLLVPLKLRPRDVTLVMLGDQYFPVGPGTATPAGDPLTPIPHGHPAAGAAERVGAAIDRVGQHMVDGVVDRQLPHGARAVRGRQLDPLLPQPEMNLPDALELGELAEHQADRLADPQVRIPLDPVVPGLDVADRDGEEQLAASGLLTQGLQGALTQDGKLHLAHRPLHAQQEPVVRQPRIVNAILVGQQASDQAAELQQRVPVPAVAGEARGLDREHDTDLGFADRHQQALEPRSCDAAAGAAEIVIDNDDLGPAELAGAVGEAVLPASALVIVQQLVGCGLAHVDVGLARQMVRRDLAHRSPPPLWTPSPSLPAGAVPAGIEVASPRPEPGRFPARVARTGPVGRRPSDVPCQPPLSVSEIDDKAVSTPRRSSRSTVSGRRGSSRMSALPASGAVIHSSTWASVPSGCWITSMVTP